MDLRLCFAAYDFLDDVERAIFGLFVDASEVFAEYSEEQELNRAENRDGGHDGRPARHELTAANEMLVEHVKNVARSEERRVGKECRL